MLDLALVDDGHGLETAVRMLAHATRADGRFEGGRRRMVEQQERAQVLAQAVVAEQRAHRKTVAHPVRARAL